MSKKLVGNIIRYVLTALVSLAVIAYIVYHLVISFGTSVETIPAQLVTVNETVTVEAYILRDETVLTSSTGGGVNCLFRDGIMVRKGAAVADVYSGTDTSTIKARISDIDDQIRILEESSVAESAAVNDSSTLGAALDSLYYNILEKVNQNNIDYAFRRKDEMLTLMNKRQIVQRVVTDYSVQIADLQSKREQLTASLTNISDTIYAPSSGYFYSEVDGYESAFNASLCDTLTIEGFKQLTETVPADYGSTAVGKIATDYKWYLACIINNDDVGTFVENNGYTVVFPYSSDTELPMTLVRSVHDDETKQTLLIFSTGYVDPNFNFLRRQSVDIVEESYTGYRVPVSAVRIVDGRKGVYVLNGNLVEFKEIETVAEIDGNMIVKERDPLGDPDYAKKLGFYDQIITKGKNLYEGKVIG